MTRVYVVKFIKLRSGLEGGVERRPQTLAFKRKGDWVRAYQHALEDGIEVKILFHDWVEYVPAQS